MTLKTWSNFSKKINSTLQPTGQSRDYTVYLKENTSIEKPVFILGTGIDAGINYCQCFGNYYFVDDIVMISADQVEVHCTLDVLATHKTAIEGYSAYIERSASAFNNMLSDPLVGGSQRIFREERASQSIFGINEDSSGVYVLGVIGGYGSGTGGISYYCLDENELGDALDFMFTDGHYTDILTDMMVKSFFNPFQYIVSLRWYPLNKGPFGTLTYTKIKYGWWETANTYGKINNITLVGAGDLTIPSPGYVDFRSYDPRFTQYLVELPTVGSVYLDPSILNEAGITVTVGLSCDIATGQTTVTLDKYVGSLLRGRIGKYQGQLGASIPLAQVNGEMGSIISNGTALGVGIASKNPAAIIGSIGGVVGSYNPPPSMLGNWGSRSSFASMTRTAITVRSYETTENPTVHHGRPLNEVRTINTLTGYIKCSNASIALAAPDTETQAVNNYLNSGFYYE